MPEQLVAVEEVALVGHVVADRQIGRRDRVDEQLEADDRLARVAQVLADDGREVAAGRVAGDGEATGVGAEQRGVRVRPARRGERVVGGGREARLGRAAVADVEDDGARGVRERPADRVVGLDRAEQPAAAVEVDDERPQLLARAGRPVRAGGDRAAGDGDHMLGHGVDGLARPEPGEERLEVGARLGNRQEMGVRAPGRRDVIEQLPGHGVERHLVNPPVGSSMRARGLSRNSRGQVRKTGVWPLTLRAATSRARPRSLRSLGGRDGIGPDHDRVHVRDDLVDGQVRRGRRACGSPRGSMPRRCTRCRPSRRPPRARSCGSSARRPASRRPPRASSEPRPLGVRRPSSSRSDGESHTAAWWVLPFA